MRIAYTVLVGKHEGRRLLGRYGFIWEDNIRMDLREMCGKVWIGCSWFRTRASGGLL
jgi:hypothetical protein